MTPHDRWLEPDDDDECETCGGSGVVFNLYANCLDDGEDGPCPDCQADNDPGEPNEEPDL